MTSEKTIAKEKTNARESLLLAACTLLVTHGSEKLTLDAVAQEAGVSKGGLLYHFPSKQALLEGVLSWLLDSFWEEIRGYAAMDTNPVGRWNRAHVQAGMKEDGEEKMRVIASLLSVISTNAHLQVILAKHIEKWCEQFYNDGLSPDKVTLIQLAVDGYFFRQMFGPVSKQVEASLGASPEISKASEGQLITDNNYIKSLILGLAEGKSL
jgi:AcrR family transcriptional regulator